MTTFAVLLGIIFVLEIVAGVLGFVYKGKVKEKGEGAVKRAVTNYYNEDEAGAKGFMDWTQKTLKCCGQSGPGDYGTIALGAIQKVCHRPRKGGGSSKIVTNSDKGGRGFKPNSDVTACEKIV